MAARSIRAAQPGDVPPMIELFRRSVREVAGRDYTLAQVTAWAPDDIDPAEWTRRLAGHSVWVAEVAGALAGFISQGGGGHIHMLFVHPDHQRQGVAGGLLDHAEGVARRGGLDRLFTEASVTARPFFQARGFRVTGRRHVTRNGQRFIRYAMDKFLRDES